MAPGGKARTAAAHGRQTASAPPAAAEEGGPALRALESHTKLLKTYMLSLKQQKAQSDALAAERSWHAEQLKLELEARTQELEEVKAKAAEALQRTEVVEEMAQMASELAARTRELEAERTKAAEAAERTRTVEETSQLERELEARTLELEAAKAKAAEAKRRLQVLEDLMEIRDTKPDIAEICAMIMEERFEDGCRRARMCAHAQSVARRMLRF